MLASICSDITSADKMRRSETKSCNTLEKEGDFFPATDPYGLKTCLRIMHMHAIGRVDESFDITVVLLVAKQILD